MTHVKTALGAFAPQLQSGLFPQIVPMFYSKFHSNKARNQENQPLPPTVSHSPLPEQCGGDRGRGLGDLAVAAI